MKEMYQLLSIKDISIHHDNSRYEMNLPLQQMWWFYSLTCVDLGQRWVQ